MKIQGNDWKWGCYEGQWFDHCLFGVVVPVYPGAKDNFIGSTLWIFWIQANVINMEIGAT